jgi:DHA2 family multidrug resistance protein
MILKEKQRDLIIFFGVFIVNMCVAFESFGVAVSSNILEGVFAVDPTWVGWLTPSYLFGLVTTVLLQPYLVNIADEKKRLCFALIASCGITALYFYRMEFIIFTFLRYLLGFFGGIILNHGGNILTQIKEENLPIVLRTFDHHIYEVCLGLSALLGGVVSQYFQWRFLFILEIVFYTLSLLCIYFLIKAPEKAPIVVEKPKKKSIFVTLGFFFCLYLYLSQLKEPWNTMGFFSDFSLILLMITVALGFVFFKQVCNHDPYLFDLRVLKDPHLCLGVFGVFASRLATYGPIILFARLMLDIYLFQYSSMGIVMGSYGLGLLVFGIFSYFLFRSSFLDKKKLVYFALIILASASFTTRYLTILSEPKFIAFLIFFYSLGISFLVRSSTLFDHHCASDYIKHQAQHWLAIASLVASLLVKPIFQIILIFRYTYHFLIFSEQAGQVRAPLFFLHQQYGAFTNQHAIPGLYSAKDNAKVYLADQITKQAYLAGFDDFCFLLGIFYLFSLGFFFILFSRYEKNKAADQSIANSERA